MARIEGLLELAAAHGDISAAKELRAHERWRIEMTRGKAPQRLSHEVAGRIEVVDTISGPPDPQLMAQLAGLAAVRGRRRLGTGGDDQADQDDQASTPAGRAIVQHGRDQAGRDQAGRDVDQAETSCPAGRP